MKLFSKKISPFFLVAALFSFTLMFSSCRVGDDDPLVSLKSRDARMTNYWTLTDLKENGVSQNDSYESLTWDIRDNGNIIQESNGEFFGVNTSTTTTGTWSFDDDKSRLVVDFEDEDNGSFEIDRLSSKDLWLSYRDGSDLYEYIFENR